MDASAHSGMQARFDASAAGFEPLGAELAAAPRLQGRIFTNPGRAWAPAGYINYGALAAGERAGQFNNYGGIDRFWIGPEGGAFGFFFDPGKQQSGAEWRVPAGLDTGEFIVVSRRSAAVAMRRELTLTNARGVEFEIAVERDAARADAAALAALHGVEIRDGAAYAACSSYNKITNISGARWTPRDGAPNIWILGQYNVSPRAEVIAPIRGGGASVYNDAYFGEIPPDRIRVAGGAVRMRADGAQINKFGLAAARTTGRAGAYDPERGLLIIIIFDTDPAAGYVNNLWTAGEGTELGGDAFQSYNSGDGTFFELESASPAAALAPGESIAHRHTTILLRGSEAELDRAARAMLNVPLSHGVDS